MRLVLWLCHLTVRLWLVLVLVVGGVIIWRLSTTTGETVCLQFANGDDYQQIAYPTLLDTSHAFTLSFPQRSVPDAVVTVSDNGSYRVQQAYHFRRIFSLPAAASVDTIGTGKSINLPAVISSPSVVWSPNGSQLAYYSVDRSAGPEIFTLVVANADGSNSVAIPLTEFNLIHYVKWSADGQYLLVASYFDAWLISAGDRQIQVIAVHKEMESVNGFEWSPQRHLLAYLWGSSVLPNHIKIFNPDTASNLGDYVRLDERNWWQGRLLWSDDLRYVAAVGWVDGHIDVIGIDGSGRSLDNVGLDQQSLASMWLPESDRFLYMTADNELVAYDAAADRYQSVATDTGVHVESVGGQHNLIFAQKQSDGTSELVRLDLRNNQRTVLMTAQAQGWINQYYLLANGEKLVASLWENDGINIYLFDLKSGERQQIASGLSTFTMQRVWSDPKTFMFFWSVLAPQSGADTRIGWDMYDLTGKRQYHFEIDTAALTGPYEAQYFVPFLSPDHRYAVFTYTDPEIYKGLIVASSDGQQAWQIQEKVWGVDFEHILWSPDSSKVAFVAKLQSGMTLLVYTADGKLLVKTPLRLSSDYLRWTGCEI